MKKLILFGAGNNGKLALEQYGVEKIDFFCDNAVEKQGTTLYGVKIISFEEMCALYDNNKQVIMITPVNNAIQIKQLESEGIYDYLLYKEAKPDNYGVWVDERTHTPNNKLLDAYVERFSDTDLLDDTSEFREITSELLRKVNNKKIFLCYNIGLQDEGLYYGNLNQLMKYAGIDESSLPYAPTVSHNALLPHIFTEHQYKYATIFSGEFYKKRIHRYYPYVPVFTVGPYLQYVEGIYSERTLLEKKNKNGKTLTIFMPHTIENVSRKYSKTEFIDAVLQKYSDDFNTIFLCVYWADITDETCKYAESLGIHIVTAGFRFDSRFDKRLKTILQLSDAVIGGDLGTHYLYAISMGIPVARIEISDKRSITDMSFSDKMRKYIDTDELISYKKRFEDVITPVLTNSLSQKEWAEPFAGFSIFRSREYVRNIFNISKDILINCNNDLNNYWKAVRESYDIYDKNGDITKMQLLKEAVGGYIY